MNDITSLEDGTYSYARPALGDRDDSVTATIQGGQLVAGTLNGQPMTGHCWKGCTTKMIRFTSGSTGSNPGEVARRAVANCRP